ncbi:protein PFC0760c-like [Raphanus sativus]|nr:protein PFC0760c-like [Raphanus sativus]
MSEINWKKFKDFNKAEENEDKSGYVAEGEEGDETDIEERSAGDESDDDKPPKEDDDPEESEDEAHTAMNKGDDLKELQARGDDYIEKQDRGGVDFKERQARGDDLNEKQDRGADLKEIQAHGDNLQNKDVRNVMSNGDEVILDAGNGGDDNRLQSLFEEGTRRSPKLNEVTRNLAAEQAKEERDEEESDPDFALEDVQYPDTPLSSDEEWEQWKNPKREKGKETFLRRF